jgi:LacI family transcriptional regulator
VREARPLGLAVTLNGLDPATQESDQEAEPALIASLRAQRPRAVILGSARDSDADWSIYRRLDAVTVVGPSVPGIRSVVVDNRVGARELASSLLTLGYTEFTVVTGGSTLSTVADRLAGFTEAVPVARIVETAFSRDGGYAAMAELLDGGTRPQCVFAVTDVMAIGVVGAIRDAGLTPGVDIAVAGFDDVPILRDVVPRLTTVALPLEDMGARALRLALSEAPHLTDVPAVRGEVRLRESTPGIR